MTSHLIDTAEEESFLEVSKYISQVLDDGQGRTALADTEGSTFFRDCEEAIEDQQFHTLLDLFIKKFDILFAKSSESSDLEASLAVTLHLLRAVPESSIPQYVYKITEAVTSQIDNKVEQRLALLTSAFNITKNPEVQFEVLLAAVKYAKTTSRATILAPALRAHLDTWIKEWNLPVDQQQTLLLAVADLFRSNAKRKILIKEAYKLTVRALSLFEDSSNVESVKQVAANAVVEFINSPDVFQFDLVESPAIVQLQNDSKFKSLHELLHIILNGDVKGLESFLSRGSSVSQGQIANESDLRAKTQLMAVLDLAAQSNRITYSAVQERLGLKDDDEVEDWLVKAIGKRLITGQMDQVKQSITITKAAHKTFGSEDWKLLQKKLHGWASNIANVQDLVQHGDSTSKAFQKQAGQKGSEAWSSANGTQWASTSGAKGIFV